MSYIIMRSQNAWYDTVRLLRADAMSVFGKNNRQIRSGTSATIGC